MSKVMLVEDDNNLREIYEARLQAEGYDIVSAHDGEEALVIAKAEQPDLIISDVMMPKISGFEMLDILRNTDGMKDVKVIMLTALGQSDDQARADRLGADRYLVKSQVTLEDIVKVTQDLLNDDEQLPAPVAPVEAVAPVEPVVTPVVSQTAPEPVAVEVAPSPAPAISVSPVAAEPIFTPPVLPEPPVIAVAAEPAVAEPPSVVPPQPVATEPPVVVTAPPVTPEPPVVSVQPVVDTTYAEPPVVQSSPVPASSAPTPEPAPLDDLQSTAAEAAAVEAQIEDFIATAPSQPLPVATPVEEPTESFMSTENLIPTTVGTQQAPPEYVPTPETIPAPVQTSDQASNDAVMAAAMEQLNVPSAQVQPAVTQPTAATEEPVINPDAAGSKRVIAPLDSVEKPDLNTLLAIEEAKEIIASNQPAAQPTIQPSVPPQPVTPPPAANQPDDPNSIAL